MTGHERHDSVREILNNYTPFRGSPTPTPGQRHIDIPEGSATPSSSSSPGNKRSSPDSSTDFHAEHSAHISKKQRTRAETPTRIATGRGAGHEELLRGRRLTLSRSPAALSPVRSVSPSISFAGAVETMLNRAEETGGNKTTKLARGMPGSPAPSRPSPVPFGQYTSEPVTAPRTYTRRDSTGTQILDTIGLGEFFQQDERPIFVLDLESPASEGLSIVFTNSALRQRPGLFDSVHGRADEAALLRDAGVPFADFKTWLLSDHDMAGFRPNFAYASVLWKANTLRKRLRVLTGQVGVVAPTADLARNGTPGLQKYQHLASSASQQAVRKYSPGPSGYFDIAPRRRKSMQTPTILEGLVTTSSSDVCERESIIEPASTTRPTSHGDTGMHDLLTASVSPAPRHESKPEFFPIRSNPENLHVGNMDYLTDKGFFDWTRLPVSPSLPDHIRFARGFDWSKTSLGPIEEWPADLRGMCNLIMASPHPAAMYWGPDYVAIYNEPYIMLAGNKHPGLMGSRYQDAWAEIWDAIVDVFEVAMTNAQATMKDDDCLFMLRNGFLEETYFSWSIIPLIGDDGSVVGLYNPCFEKTRRKIAERRMLTLREIGERTSAARAVSQFWSLLIEGFQYNEYDAPLVIVYSLNDVEENDLAASSASSTNAALKQCRLEGTLGVMAGHPCAPEAIDLKHDGNRGFGEMFRQAINSEKPIVLSAEAGTLDESLLQDIEWRGFGDPSRIVVIAPIRPTTGESTLGFMVMGTNPRRPYDEDYDLFVQLLSRQLATSIASVVLFEEEIKKGQRAAQIAAQDRIDLTKQLAVRTQEAVESENKFTRMAELAPVGMYIGDATGSITFANDAWHSISSFPRDRPIGNSWIKYVKEADQPSAWESWSTMLKKGCPVSIEFRFKTPWRDKFGNTTDTWVLASASPETDEDGNLTRVFGSVTEISSQKFAEALQRKRMEEAVETKQQQERYIDTTSHEMRNPLSAILQSADAITSSLTGLRAEDGLTTDQMDNIDSIIDSAQTITLCAQHQKRIVDDVLTLSKLDSAMLLVTPVDTQPEVIARRTVKMFEGESQTVDIQLSVQTDKSYRNLKVDYVRLDPTRLSQVLINLMTNAIKFTTTQEKRIVKMHVAASREKPSQESNYNLTYIPSQAPKDKDVTAAPEWGLGEPLYIHFAVSDTGRGLDDLEKKQLFQRFSQANPRTHVTYGGSGLGLFISRELVELQGGEIGVASEAGKGSTFAFYVKGRRSQAPVEGSEDDITRHHNMTDRKNSTGRQKSNLSEIQMQVAGAERRPIISPRTTMDQLDKSQSEASGLRVLIVEDNLINQKVLAAQLRKLGCIVSVANHGGEAIEHIKKSPFYKGYDAELTGKLTEIDVVLMDLEMPVMDGMTCARTLRAMQESGELVRHIPVIAVTANAREEQIKNTLDAGIDDVVSKPFRIPELVPKMKDTIARFASSVRDDVGRLSKATDANTMENSESNVLTGKAGELEMGS
ncbi:hypothetical protein LTR70_003211 [Exophiala xenobiotica]|uniref:Uncharacterized protein n=1 Tax=Lithohypha guttulata TaxID=1690604 RepID=A0ABR0KGV3_9EURO|nr:hypothetical protein LTR24_002856 [Lithohypha guttulata]KAK5323723.1 hypothetical protein LTR70_003211 [Exophiala xenobiotica]